MEERDFSLILNQNNRQETDVVEYKWCPRCQQYISRALFYRNAAKLDGLAHYCKPCWIVHNKECHAKRRAGKFDKRRVKMAQVQHDYFHCVEKPMQAYLLGLLASDGCVLSGRPRIQLQILEKDRVLVDVLQQELAPGHPVSVLPYKNKDYNIVRICFTSPTMCSDLAMFGVVPRKSLILVWPEALPSHLINSYLLGVLDGDGWITIDKRKRTPYYTLGFVSASRIFLERIAKEIHAVLDVPLAHLGTFNKGSTFRISYGGKSALLVSEWMHRDLPGLARKRIPG